MGVFVSVIRVANDGRIPLASVQLDGDAGERRPAGKHQPGRAAAVLRLHVPDDGAAAGDHHDRVLLPAVVHAYGSTGKTE